MTLLHLAALYNAKESALMLCQLGAVVNEKNDDDNTALHEAAENNCFEVAEILV